MSPYAAPQVPAHELAGVRRPQTVNLAFWVAIVNPLLFTVLTAVVMLMAMQALSGAMPQGDGMDDFRNAIGYTVMIVMGIFIFFYLILTGLWIAFGFKLRAGRNWARITLTVLASIWAVSCLTGLVSGPINLTGSEGFELPGGLMAMSYATNALGLVGCGAFIALVFVKPSNWYFQAASHRG
ncbi:hypothetical protein A8924_7302 [Saccharopolyspora erythraea NRRL 2338]|uniref:Uncharacterized protein n=3 Tax=Saccharopolyspora erythraea TaxID=1836 RepID=A4FPX8_SACEN|nr:hypothetical protein N599_19455 [Saccharopolyspora erythraea D]PFG99748.1 hypothetical protein A8924_7302 [Saccharopolyspora erythraea NRRL 2338]CAM06103.1 hypothetical protein SACE_6940 [Saccharopolyspora erythraea NRRL 2338]